MELITIDGTRVYIGNLELMFSLIKVWDCTSLRFIFFLISTPSSETQGQIVGAMGSLNGRKNMARRKVKNGAKSPWRQCLTRPVPNGRCHSGFWLPRKTQTFSGTNQQPERLWLFGTGLVRHCPQGLLLSFFTFLCAILFRPFRLSLAPTICPWVSEDGYKKPYKLIII